MGCLFRGALIVKNGLSFILLHGPTVDTDLPQEEGTNLGEATFSSHEQRNDHYCGGNNQGGVKESFGNFWKNDQEMLLFFRKPTLKRVLNGVDIELRPGKTSDGWDPTPLRADRRE